MSWGISQMMNSGHENCAIVAAVLSERVKLLEQEIASQPEFEDSRLRYVSLQISRELWIECCKKYCPNETWFLQRTGKGDE